METKINLKLIPIIKILLGVLVLTVLALATFRDFDHDEFEAIHSAWKVSVGEVIYEDFFQHHHPFFYYGLSPIIQIVGENIYTPLVLRVVMFSCYLVMLWCSFGIAQLIFGDENVSWLSVLLLASLAMFSQKAIEVRPDVPQVLFGLMSILFLLRHYKFDDRGWLFISAFCLGLSFLFLQKTIFIVAGVGLMQLFWMYKKSFALSRLVTYWVVFGVTISPYYLYLLASDQVETYLFWNWILNMHFEGSFSALNAMIDSFYYNHFIWIFFLIGAVLCVKRGIADLVLLSLILLATVFLVKAPYRQYFMPFLPLMSAIAAYGMFQVLKYKHLLVAMGLIIIVPLILLIRTMIIYPNQPQLNKVEWVLQQTNPQDYVYDGDIYFNLFRKDIDFFWYSTEPGKGGLGTYKKLKPYEYDIHSSILTYQPKVVSNLFLQEMPGGEVLSNYSQSERHPDLYVRKD